MTAPPSTNSKLVHEAILPVRLSLGEHRAGTDTLTLDGTRS
jgi:hypothetical protein